MSSGIVASTNGGRGITLYFGFYAGRDVAAAIPCCNNGRPEARGYDQAGSAAGGWWCGSDVTVYHSAHAQTHAAGKAAAVRRGDGDGGDDGECVMVLLSLIRKPSDFT